MPRLVYTAMAIVLVALALGALGRVIDSEGLLWFLAFIAGMLFVSLTDRHRFGWTD